MAWVVLFAYCLQAMGVREACAQNILASPSGILFSAPSVSSVPMLKAISLDPQDPFSINFVVDAGNRSSVDEEQSKAFIKYFLTFLTIPEKDLWVNLSPTEPDRIINKTFGITAAGKDMLAQDYFLKQAAASLTNPDGELGKRFWEKVLVKVKQQYGDVDVPLNSINKVWVVPGDAVVYEKEGAAFISQSHLKVMLDEDYLTMRKMTAKGPAGGDLENINGLCSKITREIVVPEVERQVNEGQNFAKLRQMYHSLILAIWFKRQLQVKIINQLYAGQKKIAGIDTQDKDAAQRIYGQYMAALKQGAYDMIREEYDPDTQEIVPRRFFSGGFSFEDAAQKIEFRPVSFFKDHIALPISNFFRLKFSLVPRGVSRKLFLSLAAVAGLSASSLPGSPVVDVPSALPVPAHQLVVDQASPALSGAGAETDRVNAPKPYALSLKAPVAFDETGLTAQMGGIVSGLDQAKKTYRKGDVVFRLANPGLVHQREELAKRLSIEEGTLGALKGLQEQGGASAAEITPAQEKVDELRRQLALLDQKGAVQEVKAPCDLLIKETLVSNGMTVNKGTKVISYFDGQRVRLNIEMPTTQTYFGRIKNFRIDGQPVQKVFSVDWRLNPKKTGALVSFLVGVTSPIPANKTVQVDVEMLPPVVKDGLGAVRGQAQTLASVRTSEERVFVAPARGTVKFYVNEGDRVEAGQVLAEVVGQAYVEEYRSAVKEFNSIKAQLEQAADDAGTRHILRSQETALEARKASLRSQVMTLQEQISRLRIIASESGVIKTIMSDRSTAFSEGDELLRLDTGRVTIGDINDMNASILLPRDLKITMGDPVVVEAPSGKRLIGRVSAINESPITQDIELGPVQAVSVIVDEGADNLLGVNLPVQVIVPAADEKGLISEELKRIEKARAQIKSPVSSSKRVKHVANPGAPAHDYTVKKGDSLWKIAEKELGNGTLWEQLYELNKDAIANPDNLKEGTVLSIPGGARQQEVMVRRAEPVQETFVSSGRSIKMSEVTSRVAGNNLLNGDLRIDILEKQAAERLPHAFKLSLNGGVFVNNNGSLAYSGGLNAAFDGVMAGVSSGNAIGAASPVVFGIAGELVDLISGKKVKEKNLALKMTEIARYHMESAVAGQVSDAADLFVDIGHAQQRIIDLQSLTANFEEALNVVKTREAQGFATTAERNALTQKIEGVRAQLLDWQNKKKQLTIQLNQMLGVPSEKLQGELAPEILWNGEFPVISEDQQASLLRQLTGEGSENYRLRGARVAYAAVEETIRLQGLEYLPSADLTGLFIASPDGKMNPLYGLVPSQTLSSSALKVGGNGAAHFEIPLIDTGRSARRQIVNLEKQKAQIHLDTVKGQLGEELVRALANIRDLGRQIAQGERDYQASIAAWQTKLSRSDLYRKDQLLDERLRMSEASERLTGLKAAYFKAESSLRRLQILGQNRTFVRPAKAVSLAPQLAAAVSRSVQPGGAEAVDSFSDQEFILDLPDGNIAGNPVSGSRLQDPGVLAAGAVTFPSLGDAHKGGGSDLWALMTNPENKSSQESQIDATVRTLIEDPNIKVRMSALRTLTEEFQYDRNFLDRVEQVVLNSPYPEVVENLLRFAVNRDGSNVRFLVNVLNTALEQKRSFAAQQGFELLSDILIQNPGAIEQLAGVSSVKTGAGGSGDSSRQVLLAFMSWAPEDSLARARLLQSQYWTPEQLAQIYRDLKSAGASAPEGLAPLVFDEILRREALANIEDVFHPGPFSQMASSFFESDIRALIMFKEWGESDARFLTASPRWREMKDFIAPALYERAKKAADALVSSGIYGSTTTFLSVDTMNGAGAAEAGSAYFNSLNLDDQKEFVRATKDVPRLARIFGGSTTLRGMALNRLMEAPLGRIMALQVYLGSEDKELCGLVENRNWIDTLRGDVQLADNPAASDVYRNALEKLARRTGEEAFLHVRLGSYSLPELYRLDDRDQESHRSQQIKMTATRLAIELTLQMAEHQGHWISGQAFYSSREKAVINELKQRISTVHDPEELNVYLDQLRARGDSGTKKILGHIEDRRDKFVDIILRNDQRMAWITMIHKVILGGIGILLTCIFTKSSYKDVRRKASTIGQLIRELRRGFLVKSGNGKVHLDGSPSNVVIIQETGLDKNVIKPLQSWRAVVSQWRHNPPEKQVMFRDLNFIINNAFDVIRKTPYTPELMLSVDVEHVFNAPYQKTLQYFSLLVIDTLNGMNDLLERSGSSLDEYERQKLLGDIKTLKDMSEYANRFLRVLELRGNIDKVMSYKFSDEHSAEVYKIYPFMREALGQGYHLRRCEKQMKEELVVLLREGENLLPSLYGDQDDISTLVEKSRSQVATVIKDASNLISFGTQTANSNAKMGRFYRRILAFAIPVAGVVGILTGGPVIVGLSLLGLGNFIVRLAIEWDAGISNLDMPWSKSTKAVVEKLVGEMQKKMPGPIVVNEQSSEKGRVRLAIKDGMEKLKQELEGPDRNIDMVVILPENTDKDDVRQLRHYVDSRRGRVFRNDIPVEVFSPKRGGSGNAYLEAVGFVQDSVRRGEIAKRYPNLKGIPWQDLRVMFIFPGSRDVRNDLLIDWSIINGYRAVRAAAGACFGPSLHSESPETSSGRGGHLQIYSRDAYFGPMQAFEPGDIGLFADWVNEETLKSRGLLHLDPVGNQFAVQEILQKLNVTELKTRKRLHPGGILQYLLNNYNLDNSRLGQYPGLMGVIASSPRMVKAVGDFLDQQKRSGLLDSFKYLNFTNDILNVWIKPQEDTKGDYLEERLEWDDVRGQYAGQDPAKVAGKFRSLYEALVTAQKSQIGGSLQVNATVPYPGDSVVFHVNDPKDVQQVLDVLNFGNAGRGNTAPWLPGPPLSSTVDDGAPDEAVERKALDLQEPSAVEPVKPVDLLPETVPVAPASSITPIVPIVPQTQQPQDGNEDIRFTPSDLEAVVEAVSVIPLDQVARLGDRHVVDDLVEKNAPAKESILYFAGLNKGQKIAVLKMAIAQLKAENASLSDQVTEDQHSADVAPAVREFIDVGVAQAVQGELAHLKEAEARERAALRKTEERKTKVERELEILRANKRANQLDLIVPMNEAVSKTMRLQAEIDELAGKIADLQKRRAAIEASGADASGQISEGTVAFGLSEGSVEYVSEIGVLTKKIEKLRGEKGSRISSGNRRQMKILNDEIFLRTETFARGIMTKTSQGDPVLAGLSEKYLQYAGEVEALKRRIQELRGEEGAWVPEYDKKQMRSLYGRISALRNFRMTPLRRQIISRLKDVNSGDALEGGRQPAQDDAQVSRETGGVDFSGAGSEVQFNSDGQIPESPELWSPARTAQALKLFQGFDFRIISLQPFMDPVEFAPFFAAR